MTHLSYETWYRESQMQMPKPEWLVPFESGGDPILIRRSRDPFGWMGNMSPYPLTYEGENYRTSEALFQVLRTDDEEARNAIRAEKSPMMAKSRARKYQDRRNVVCLSEADLNLMRITLHEKVKQHPHLKDLLLKTEDRVIIEDCSKRQRGSGLFWGAALQEDGTWKGANWLGVLWMEFRRKIGENRSSNSILDML